MLLCASKADFCYQNVSCAVMGNFETLNFVENGSMISLYQDQ